jgi:hypothetical protein
MIRASTKTIPDHQSFSSPLHTTNRDNNPLYTTITLSFITGHINVSRKKPVKLQEDRRTKGREESTT